MLYAGADGRWINIQSSSMLAYILSGTYVLLWGVFGWLAGHFLAYSFFELRAGRVATRKYALRWMGVMGITFLLAGTIGELQKRGHLTHDAIESVGLIASASCLALSCFLNRRKLNRRE